MTTLDEEHVNASTVHDELDCEQTDHGADELRAVPSFAHRWAAYAAAHPGSKRARTLRTLRELETRAIDLPVIGKFHRPDKHDVVYVVGLTALLAFGAVELPIAVIVLGGHVLVKQHSSRSLAAVGEVMEDVFGHHI
ncbi:hypothetical protein [Mycobacterium montefiorense]|uniref:hypothetical protein n=1 Tax=Mycobacterium montefiorense TaxID=154654 RepID=UPI0021F35BE0|nr:hypothetical protein [Mycobacterium montefiorense]MCV7426327.1 hypothetical protein [Mycobacterium montefiorense]GLE53511.1 hypothetical protein ATCCBAA256_30710 [Mycobacterium montefiorense]